MSLFITYTDTPGLERIEGSQRYVVYRRIHKRLLVTDSEYRVTVRSYNAAIFAIILIGLIGLPLMLSNQGELIFVSVLLQIIYTPLLILVAFKHQKYQNVKIGDELNESNTAEQGAAANP